MAGWALGGAGLITILSSHIYSSCAEIMSTWGLRDPCQVCVDTRSAEPQLDEQNFWLCFYQWELSDSRWVCLSVSPSFHLSVLLSFPLLVCPSVLLSVCNKCMYMYVCIILYQVGAQNPLTTISRRKVIRSERKRERKKLSKSRELLLFSRCNCTNITQSQRIEISS